MRLQIQNPLPENCRLPGCRLPQCRLPDMCTCRSELRCPRIVDSQTVDSHTVNMRPEIQNPCPRTGLSQANACVLRSEFRSMIAVTSQTVNSQSNCLGSFCRQCVIFLHLKCAHILCFGCVISSSRGGKLRLLNVAFAVRFSEEHGGGLH